MQPDDCADLLLSLHPCSSWISGVTIERHQYAQDIGIRWISLPGTQQLHHAPKQYQNRLSRHCMRFMAPLWRA